MSVTGKTCATGGLNVGSSAGTADPSGGVNGDVYFQIGTTAFSTEILNLVYPVGSIYITTSSSSPATLFPGTTWTAISQGRVLVGVGENVTVGSVTKTFSVNDTGGEYESAQINFSTTSYGLQPGSLAYNDRAIVSQRSGAQTSEINAGVNLMQPYFAVYMWKRTA